MNDRIRELGFFLRVSEEASFSAAARSLDLDPSTISKVIQRLEHTSQAFDEDKATLLLPRGIEGARARRFRRRRRRAGGARYSPST